MTSSVSTAATHQRKVAIVLHDVAPETWPQCEQLIHLVQAIAPTCPLTLLVVPHFHRRSRIDSEDQKQWRTIIDKRLAAGDELALHGYFHVDEAPGPRSVRQWIRRRVLTAGEGEFAALDKAEVCARIERGLQLFQQIGWHPLGFVAPAWQIGSACKSALAEFPFKYTSDLRALYALPQWQRIAAFSLSFSSRTAWRRALSPLWNRWTLRALASTELVRIALHPADANYPSLLAAWREVIESALESRFPVTKASWLAQQISESRPVLAVA